MTERNWDKARRYERDAGSIADVPDTSRPWTGPQERKLRAAERAQERKEYRERSQQYDLDATEAAIEANIRKLDAAGVELSDKEKAFLIEREKRRMILARS